MRIDTYKEPQSSFLSIEKDLSIIVEKIMKNNSLKKLLWYTTPDCMSKPNLTEDETLEMFGKQIKIVPKLQVDGEILNYVIINFDNFTPTDSEEWRDNIIEFDVICHFDQWRLGDFKLRPYRIAAEVDSMVNDKKFSGIGTLKFLGANQMILTDEYAGLCLMYQAVHGDEDKKNALNSKDQEQIVNNFYDMINNG